MCNFYHCIVHLICRFCTRFSYTVIRKHSQFYVSVTQQLSLEQLNDKFYVQYSVHHGSIYQEIPTRCHVTVLCFLCYRTRGCICSQSYWSPDDGHGTCPKHVEKSDKTGNKVLWRDILLVFLDKLNDNYFKSVAHAHPCRPPAKTAALLHLFFLRV
jgi:hypothetical protein